jgi:hypothetical protein
MEREHLETRAAVELRNPSSHSVDQRHLAPLSQLSLSGRWDRYL